VRSIGKARRFFFALLFAVPAACAGDGTGLDEFGNPISGNGQPLRATFSSIQARILSPICTQCHAGPSAPLGFSMEAGVSYGNLVDVPSAELPELMRVKPGQPDSSYIVLKIEGAPGIVGGRMPLGLAPLSAEEIQAIRDWIADGALRN
jgi:hypothetical protein